MAAGKKKRSTRRRKRRQRHAIEDLYQPTPFYTKLVGFHGRVVVKRLRPAARSRADKLWEAKQRQEYEEQCYRIEKQITYHENVLQQIKSSRKCESSHELYQELCALRSRSLKCLRYLLKGAQPRVAELERLEKLRKDDRHIDMMLRRLPQLQGSRDVTGLKTEIRVHPNSTQNRLASHKDRHLSQIASSEERSPKPLQLFVYGVSKCKVVTLRELYPENMGEDLINVITRTLGQLPPNCSIVHGKRRVASKRTLKEQGIEDEANIHVNLKLLGGMEAAGSNDDGANAITSEDPRQWPRTRVIKWLDSVCKSYEIDIEEVSLLKTLNGAGLSELQKEDWIRRSPGQGDFLYGKWKSSLEETVIQQEDKSSNREREQAAGIEATSGNTVEDEVVQEQAFIQPEGKHDDSASLLSSSESSPLEGKFEVSQDIEIYSGVLGIDDLLQSAPQIGSIISLTGLCSSRPIRRGGAGSLLLRNDPPKGTKFSQIKVDLRSSNLLSKHKIDNLLNIQLGEGMAVLGRVEKLDEGYSSRKEGFEIMPFKIVVDSDTHGIIRFKKTNMRSIIRQHSTPWHTQVGMYPAEDPINSQPLLLGDTFEKDQSSIFLPPGTDASKVKTCVVALRNTMTGDIFIGVNGERKIIGETMQRGKVIEKREELCKAIGSILPCVDSEVELCSNADDALKKISNDKSFIAFMLLESGDDSEDEEEKEQEESNLNLASGNSMDTANISVLIQIHIVKGSRAIHFAKQSDTHAYVRVGTETKEMSDYDDLCKRLESLAWRPVSGDHHQVKEEIENACRPTKEEEKSKIKVFKQFKFEKEDREFKAVYGNPKKIILKKYFSPYTAAFLNTRGGEIYFGVEEDSKTKVGYAIGVVLSEEERKQLLKESAEKICNFWPHVESSQFLMTFMNVDATSVIEKALKFPKTAVGKEGKAILLNLNSPADIGKAQNLVKEVRKDDSTVTSLLRVKDCSYCILTQSQDVNMEQIVDDMERKLKQTKNISLDSMSTDDLSQLLNDACIVRLKVDKSRFPIHLTHPLVTYILDKDGEVREMTSQELIDRLQSRIRNDNFNVDKFLETLNQFDYDQSSFILMTAPFELKKDQQDLTGLVIPEWTMVLDFDQKMKSDGHLFEVFQHLHDEHQVERNLSLKTPCDRKFCVDSDNGVCWYAVRGYEELGDTLSEPGHGNWNMKHGDKIKSHLKELIYKVSPNHLYVICMYNHGQEDILPSMHMLLEQILSIYGKTTVVFLCPDTDTKNILETKLIGPLEPSYENHIKKDNVFVVSVEHLSRYLAVELKPTYQSENVFQVPKRHRSGPSGVPEALPQYLRQAIQGHLQIMYLGTGMSAQGDKIKEERKTLFSGSAISNIGLANDIGIKRNKLKEVTKILKDMLEDKKSHVSMIVLKAERGSGATTLCRQMLYKFHKRYPCAQLKDFHKNLVTNIEEINKHTNLPLILFVDSDIAYMQDFTDLKNEAEIRNANVIFVVVDSDVTFNVSGHGEEKFRKKKRKSTIPYVTGTAPYKIVHLSRELEMDEITRLVEELHKLDSLSEEKEEKLQKLQEDAIKDRTLRKFAHFSLTVFGKSFTRLEDYVRYRLDKTTSENQAHILDFLAITHTFTEGYFPVSALSEMVKEKRVLLDVIFNNLDVLELLSPPSKQQNGRRISFREVAEEILRQRALQEKCDYAEFLKITSLRLARNVLSTRQPSKRIQRLNKRLFFTSEYEHDKYSPLIRCIKDEKTDTALSTLEELTEIFSQETSLWAHLQAHLAKFYMQEYGRYEDAMKCITDAIKEQENDILLQHIHGDIIRLQIKNLSTLGAKSINVENMIRLAIESSSCFENVRRKRPYQELGYTSDVLVRQILMEAVARSTGKTYTESLRTRLEDISSNKFPLRMEDKYLFSLYPEALGLLQDIQLNEHTQQLKTSIVTKMGSKEDIENLCKEMTACYSGNSDDAAWVKDSVSRTLNAVSVTELETIVDPSQVPAAADKLLSGIARYVKTCDERSMKCWVRYCRSAAKVPSLNSVCETVGKWYKETDGKSRFAAFYKYVTELLKALQNPNDIDKMKAAGKSTDAVRSKQYSRKEYLRIRTKGLPFRLEWLHPKEGRHINSIDCLLHDDDLMKDYMKTDGKTTRSHQVRREDVEKALFERKITKWEGVVKSIETDLKGTIILKNYIPVHFTPSHARPFQPETGATVQFYLSFDWNGPHAWDVVCPAGQEKRKKSMNVRPRTSLTEESASDSNEDELDCDDFSIPLYKAYASKAVPRVSDPLELLIGKQVHGVVVFVDENKGFGKIRTPNADEDLYFHKSKLCSLSISEVKIGTPVVCTVQPGCMGTNISQLKQEEVGEDLRTLLSECTKKPKRNVSPSKSKPQPKQQPSRLDGTVVKLLPRDEYPKTCGFIRVDGDTNAKNVYFNAWSSGIGTERMKRIAKGCKVQFSLGKNKKGDVATDIYIQELGDVRAATAGCPLPTCSRSCGWEKLIGQDFQGVIVSFNLHNSYGFIENPSLSQKGLYFVCSDIQRNDFNTVRDGLVASFKVSHNGRSCSAIEIVILQNLPPSYQQRPMQPLSRLQLALPPRMQYPPQTVRMPPPPPFGHVPQNFLDGYSSPTDEY